MNDTPLSAEQIKAVKGDGFLHNRSTRTFSGRVITKNGVLTAQETTVLAEAAGKYGNGTICFTVRLTVELPGIEYENIEPFKGFLAAAGLKTGGTGAKVRPVVACKGTTCVYGLCDTQQLARQIHDRFYEGYHDVTLPHKFKITVGGCPNNCAKIDLNDLGVIGQRVPRIQIEACRGCLKCGVVNACPMGAAKLSEGKIKIDPAVCNNCGRCVGKCPFHINNGFLDRYKIFVGGKWGKTVRIGTPLHTLFTKEQALDVIEKAILLFKSEGLPQERFGQTCDRLGMETVNQILVSDDLLENKAAILHPAGAKC